MKLLHVDSSILGADSASRRLTQAVVDRFVRADPGLEVVRRDLAAEPLAHLSGALLAAGRGGATEGDEALARDLARDRQALAEFLAADVVVIGAPMYNFTVPTQLKAWLDRLAVAGTTFKYTAEGAVGLVGGKRVVVVSTRGGVYAEGGPDFQEPYLRAFFAFLGVTDVEVVRAEGLALGPAPRQRALDEAAGRVAALATDAAGAVAA